MNIPSDAERYIQLKDKYGEFDDIVSRLKVDFKTATSFKVMTVESPENDGEGGEQLLIEVRCNLDRQGFRGAVESFFAEIRSLRIYPLIAVLQDI